jgi:adenylate cyclase
MFLFSATIIIALIIGLGIYLSVRFFEINSLGQRLTLSGVLFASFTALAVIFAATNDFEAAELSIYDLMVRQRGKRELRPEIVICSVDNKTRLALKSVDPIPRKYMAQVITNLTDAGAMVISLDYTFSRPNIPGTKELAEAISNSNVVLAMSVQSGQSYFSDNLFREGAIAEGMINVYPDPDSSMRRMEFLRYMKSSETPGEWEYYPAFSIASLLAYLQIDNADHVRGIYDDNPEIRFDVYEQKIVGQDEEGFDIIELGKLEQTLRIPISGFFINYVGPPGTVSNIPFSDALSGNFDNSRVDGKIVFIGDTRQAGSDVFPTPFNMKKSGAKKGAFERRDQKQMPGIEVHANALSTILDANEPPGSKRYSPYLTWFDGPWFIAFLIAFGVALGVIFCFLRLPIFLNVIFFAAITGGGFLISRWLFAFHNNIFVPTVPVVFLIAANFVGGTFLHWLLDRMRNKLIIGQWGRYMSKNIVEKIVSGELTVNTAGHEKELTLLFSDIRGFTTASEGLGPEGIARLLNAFFNRMITCVFDSDGTMDKLMGDCIMAFWNDPVSQPDHRKRACETALNMMEELRKFNSENPVPGADKVNIGIGLNSGPATVGDLGADFYSDYTALGDTVNTAARLEGINKYYRSNIIISNDTHEPVKEHFEARHIDTIRVKGRTKPVEIFELICRKGELSEEKKKQLESFEAAWEIYKTRDWEAAHHMFTEHLKSFPDDGPAQTLLERADTYRRTPPPKNWDGVYDFETK